MKANDFRSPFGVTILMKTVISINFKNYFYHAVDMVRSIWLGHRNGFGDFQGRCLEAIRPIDGSTLDAQDPLWG